MEQRVSLITLGVGDLARARRFYEQGLGWRPLDGPAGVVFFQLPGMVFGLWPRSELAKDAGLPAGEDGAAPAASGIALAHNVRRREEVDAVLAQAERAGARILKPAAETFWGGYAGYFADPDGHLWEIAWNPGWRIDESGATWAES
ncbi:MAG: VOC family protein [Amphiplicatus sp.]